MQRIFIFVLAVVCCIQLFLSGVVSAEHREITGKEGTINLCADENAQIIFNDRITAENNTSILNINSSTDTITANGKLVLNEDISEYTGKVNIYGAEVELHAKSDKKNKNTNKFFSENINFESGTLNLSNGATNKKTVTSWESKTNNNLEFDIDLSDNSNDSFEVENEMSADLILNLTAINTLNGSQIGTGTIPLFQDGRAPPIPDVLATVHHDRYEYNSSTISTIGKLEYKVTGSITPKIFKDVVINTFSAIKNYSISKKEEIIEYLDQLGGTQLTIFGNGYLLV